MTTNIKKAGAVSILTTMVTGLLVPLGAEAFSQIKSVRGRVNTIESRTSSLEAVQKVELEMLKEIREDIKIIIKEMPRK